MLQIIQRHRCQLSQMEIKSRLAYSYSEELSKLSLRLCSNHYFSKHIVIHHCLLWFQLYTRPISIWSSVSTALVLSVYSTFPKTMNTVYVSSSFLWPHVGRFSHADQGYSTLVVGQSEMDNIDPLTAFITWFAVHCFSSVHCTQCIVQYNAL